MGSADPARRDPAAVEELPVEGTWTDFRELSRTTLGDLLERYGRTVTPTKKGAEREMRRIDAWLRDPLASLPITAVSLELLQDWIDRRMRDGAASNTVRLDMMLIRAA